MIEAFPGVKILAAVVELMCACVVMGVFSVSVIEINEI